MGAKPVEEIPAGGTSANLFQCHRLAPFCNYNGNTFVTIVKTLLDEELNRLPADQSFLLRNIAGHIVAGTATDIERKQLDAMLAALEK